MKKRVVNKVLPLFLLAIFIVPILVSAYDSPLSSPDISGLPPLEKAGGVVWKPVEEMFTDWSAGNLSLTLAKWIFLILIFAIIYALSSYLPFFGAGARGLRILFSALVAFLATAYITPEEVFVILTSYTALGIVLGSIIPFIILFFFTMKAAEKGGPALFLQWFAWLSFTTWLVYKLILLMIDANRPAGVGETVLWIHLFLTVAGVILILFNRQIRRILKREMEKEDKEAIMTGVRERGIVRDAQDAEFASRKRSARKER